MTNMESAVLIAKGCSFREIKNMLSNAHTANMGKRYDKHEGGKTISRRDSTKEKAHGKTKHQIAILTASRQVKTLWTREDLEEFTAGIYNAEAFVESIKKELRAGYNKLA